MWDMALDYLAPDHLFEVKDLRLMLVSQRRKERERERQGVGHRNTDREGLV
jgi:hypothetical protein